MQITIQKQDKRNVLLMLLLSLLLQGLKLALAHLPNESINQKWYSGLKINECNFVYFTQWYLAMITNANACVICQSRRLR